MLTERWCGWEGGGPSLLMRDGEVGLKGVGLVVEGDFIC